MPISNPDSIPISNPDSIPISNPDSIPISNLESIHISNPDTIPLTPSPSVSPRTTTEIPSIGSVGLPTLSSGYDTNPDDANKPNPRNFPPNYKTKVSVADLSMDLSPLPTTVRINIKEKDLDTISLEDKGPSMTTSNSDFKPTVQVPKQKTLKESLDLLKNKISNSELKSNFNLEKLGDFFSNFMSGNEFLDNLDVKQKSDINILKSNSIDVKNSATIKKLITNSMKSKAVTISNNEITFNKNSIFKLGNTKMVRTSIIKFKGI